MKRVDLAKLLAEHAADVTSYDAGDIHGCSHDPMLELWPRGTTGSEAHWNAYYEHLADVVLEAMAAPTPAPVAVPEGGWREGDWFVTDETDLYAMRGGAWKTSDRTLWDTEEHPRYIQWLVENRRILHVHAPRETVPRPEPAAASLPTEGVLRAHMWDNGDEGLCSCGWSPGWWDGVDQEDEAAFEPVVAAFVTHQAEHLIRLVPADDEDTVRVPTEAVERLARLLDPEETAIRMDGTPSLMLSLCAIVQQCIEHVYADGGDSSAYVLASNIATDLENRLSEVLARLVPEDDEDTVRVPRDGAARIAAERQRQIEAEGWTRDHDAAHDGHDLVLAAVSYALPDTLRGSKRSQFYGSDDLGGDKVWVPMHWPWLGRFWRPTPRDRVRELEKAGALIAAEIDRLIGRPAL